MTTKTDALQDRVTDALMELAHTDIASALSIAAGVFVSLTLSYLRAQGQDSDKEITINGGEGRDITIHAPKDKT